MQRVLAKREAAPPRLRTLTAALLALALSAALALVAPGQAQALQITTTVSSLPANTYIDQDFLDETGMQLVFTVSNGEATIGYINLYTPADIENGITGNKLDSEMTTLKIPSKVSDGTKEYPVVALSPNTSLYTGQGKVNSGGGNANIFGDGLGNTDNTLFAGGTYPAARPGNQTLQFTKVIIPASVKTLSGSVFGSMSNVTTVEFEEGSSLTTMTGGVFRSCTSLESIELPEGLTTITFSNQAPFAGCISLESIKLPASLTSLNKSGSNFYLTTDAPVKSIEIADNSGLTTWPTPAYAGMQAGASPLLEEFSFGENSKVTTIEGRAFSNAYNLKSLDIPNTVTTIGAYAFAGSGLRTLDLPDEITSIGTSALENTQMTSVVIPKGVSSLPTGLLQNNTRLSRAVIEYQPSDEVDEDGNRVDPGLLALGNNVFANDTLLESVVFTGDISKLTASASAFANCVGLTDIVFTGDVADMDLSGMSASVDADAVTFWAHADQSKNLKAWCIENGYNYRDIEGELGTFLVSSFEGVVDWTGNAVEPEIELALGDAALVEGRDYSVSYRDNVNPGAAYAIVTGMGSYYGSFEVPFSIVKSIEEAEVSLENPIVDCFTGTTMAANVPYYAGDVSVAVDGVELEEGVDYDVFAVSTGHIGDNVLTVVGQGAYTGFAQAVMKVSEPTFDSANLVDIADQVYDSETPATPAIEVYFNDRVLLYEGQDYTVEYQNNTAVGTGLVIVTGMGHFTGSMAVKTFEIVEPEEPSAAIALKDEWFEDIGNTNNYVYDGTAKEPEVTLTS